jgi:hypothetical protein
MSKEALAWMSDKQRWNYEHQQAIHRAHQTEGDKEWNRLMKEGYLPGVAGKIQHAFDPITDPVWNAGKAVYSFFERVVGIFGSIASFIAWIFSHGELLLIGGGVVGVLILRKLIF